MMARETPKQQENKPRPVMHNGSTVTTVTSGSATFSGLCRPGQDGGIPVTELHSKNKKVGKVKVGVGDGLGSDREDKGGLGVPEHLICWSCLVSCARTRPASLALELRPREVE